MILDWKDILPLQVWRPSLTDHCRNRAVLPTAPPMRMFAAAHTTSRPWRTFTLSAPLQRGVWLLRRLRPPSRALACSRPLAGPDGVGVPQFR